MGCFVYSPWNGGRDIEKGSLVCVGVGMMLGAHLTPRARACIEQADVVFAAVSDALVELWLQEMHPDVRSLQPLYAEGRPRIQTYRAMSEAMLIELRAGRSVCGAFYGHPGVFALAPHLAMKQARAEGFHAHMEPGISAEDCLYADLEIDPGDHGCQHYEASQFMFYRRRIDTSACLVLWQVGIAGDRSMSRFSTGAGHRALLLDALLEQGYPPDHGVIVYEAATSPLAPVPRIEKCRLQDLADVDLRLQTTLVLPPASAKELDGGMQARLAAIESANSGK